MIIVPTDEEVAGNTPQAPPLPTPDNQPPAPSFFPTAVQFGVNTNEPSGIFGSRSARQLPPVKPEPVPGQPLPHPQETKPSTLEAAFGLGNDVENAVNYFSRPQFPPDPNYSPLNDPDFKDSQYEQYYADRFVGSQSSQESRAIMNRIDQENQYKDVMARSGWKGILAGMTAGVLSPTMLIPVAGWLKTGEGAAMGARVALAAGETAALSAGAAGAQEGVLHATQETRSYSESVWNMAGAAVLGAALGGGATALLSGSERAAAEHALTHFPGDAAEEQARVDANLTPGLKADPYGGPPTAVGAQVTDASRGTGIIEPALGAEKVLGFQSAGSRALVSPSRAERLTAYDLAETAVSREDSAKGIVPSDGGPVESMIRQAHVPEYQTLQSWDQLFAQYRLGNANALVPKLRAAFADATGQGGGSLTWPEFKQAISDAWLNGDVHPIPEVQQAAIQGRKVLTDMANQAADLGVPGFSRDMKPQSGDRGYIPRDYNTDAIAAQKPAFLNTLMVAGKRAQARAIAKTEAWRARTSARLNQQISDLGLSGDQRASTLAQLEGELKQTREAGQQFGPTEDTLQTLRQQLVAQRAVGDRGAEQTSAAIKAETDRAGANYADYVTKRNALSSRLRDIRGNVVGRENQVEALRGKIAETENANVDRLYRMHSAITKLEADMADMEPEELASQLDGLRTQFSAVLDRSNKAQERLAAANEGRAKELQAAIDAGDAAKAEALQKRIDLGDPFVTEAKQIDQMNKLADQIGELEHSDPEAAATELKGLIEKRLAQSAQVVEDSGRYMMALTERLRKADPNIVKDRIAALQKRVGSVETRASSKLAEMSDQELHSAVSDIANNILGHSPTRMLTPADAAAGLRGSLKARVLHFVTTSELKPFLRWDAGHLLHRYVRTMAPDLALMKKFGSLDLTGELGRINDDWDKMAAAAKTDKERLAIDKPKSGSRAVSLNNIITLRDRLRGTNNLPTNPQGLAHRSMAVVRDLNYMRMLGMVVAGDISHIAKIAMVHGFTNQLKVPFTALTHGLGAIKMAGSEVRLAGSAWDVVHDQTMSLLGDVMNNEMHGTKFERGIHSASSKFSLLNGMAYWISAEKQWAGIVVQTKMLQAIEKLGAGEALPRKQTVMLANNYIDRSMAQRIAAEAENWKKTGGVWWANTAEWKDRQAASTFLNGLGRDVNSTIVTPGVGDAPNWMTTDFGRVISQFRAFNMASSQRTIIPMLQRRDGNALSGSIFMMAMGAMSYYLRSSAAGNFDSDPRVVAMNAFERSGLAGWFTDAGNIADRVTGWQTALAGQRASKTAEQGLPGLVLGPSFDFAENAAKVSSAAAHRQVSAADVHAFRRLLPAQNVMGIRKGFDAMEEATDNAFGVQMRPSGH